MKIFTIILITIMAVILVACSAHGGGWIISSVGEGKATFGFTINCTQIDAHNIVLSGKFQFNDHPAGINIHGDIVQPYTVTSTEISCDEPFVVGNPTFIGSFTMMPSGETGKFTFTTSDYGEPGPDAGDYITIRLYDGPAYTVPPFYAHGGVVGGGNIQIK